MAEVRFAFFDVDHTLLRGSTGKDLAFMGIRKGLFSRGWILSLPFFYIQYRVGLLDPAVLGPLMEKLKGLPIWEISEMAEEAFLKDIKPKIYRGAVRLLETERAAGRRPVLATSAPETAVRPLADYLGVSDVIASRFEVEAGLLTGAFEGEPAFGAGKMRKARRFAKERSAELSRCSFYTDSHYDLPLLEEVEEPVAVNPDRRLLRLAGSRGWKVLRLKGVLGHDFSEELPPRGRGE
jgi:HAD superfamily hydrolase (TIGR01490 family)